ncbi:hypothetical protein KKG52_00585 [Patescibacteria group bacterium]|nr:hypothetical protein [Patescibacteria group bacterium]
MVREVYDWLKKGDFEEGFSLIASETVSSLEKLKQDLEKYSQIKKVLPNPFDQTTRNLMLLNSLSKTVVGFFTHNDNSTTRSMDLATGRSGHTKIAYGVQGIDGVYSYGLFYIPGTLKNPQTNPIPLNKELINALWTGKNLPSGVKRYKTIISRLGGISQMDIMNQIISTIKPSSRFA